MSPVWNLVVPQISARCTKFSLASLSTKMSVWRHDWHSLFALACALFPPMDTQIVIAILQWIIRLFYRGLLDFTTLISKPSLLFFLAASKKMAANASFSHNLSRTQWILTIRLCITLLAVTNCAQWICLLKIRLQIGQHKKIIVLRKPQLTIEDVDEFFFYPIIIFLDAFSHLYKRVCPSVRRSVPNELNFWEIRFLGWIWTK